MFDVFDILFFNFRLLVKVFLEQLNVFMRTVNTLIEWQNRYNGVEEQKNEITKIFNNYLALILEFKNLYLSDIKWFAPIKYELKHSDRSISTKVAVITGADRDVGKEATIQLAKNGIKIILGVKDLQSGQIIIDSIKKENDALELKAYELDLSSLQSVRKFAAQVSREEPKIDLLINSSEQLNEKLVVTEEGLEKTFAENYLGHFLLTQLLIDNLKKSPNGRIINVSDMLYHFGTIGFDDINLSKEYNVYLAFARSKLAQVLATKELAERLKDTNITTYALSTNTLRQWKPFPEEDWRKIFNPWFAKIADPVNGSQTILYLALEDELKNESGFYYNNCERVPYVTNTTDSESVKLWQISNELVGIKEQPKGNVIQFD